MLAHVSDSGATLEERMSELAIRVVGLGVIGRNRALSLERQGFSLGVWAAWGNPS
jgi:hypothetical protein